MRCDVFARHQRLGCRLAWKESKLVAQLKQRPAADIVLCPIVLAELWYGVCRSDPVMRATNEALVRQLQAKYLSAPFDDVAARDAGEIRAELSAIGNPIGPYDLLIAAIARTQQLTLVTHNHRGILACPRADD